MPNVSALVEKRVASRGRGSDIRIPVGRGSQRNTGLASPGNFFRTRANSSLERGNNGRRWPAQRRVAEQPIKIEARKNAKILISLARRSGHVDRARCSSIRRFSRITYRKVEQRPGEDAIQRRVSLNRVARNYPTSLQLPMR